MTASLGRILVVDDDDVIRQLITVNLELEGFEVTTAVDGQDCLDKVKDVDPAVITLDIMMPRLDGWETASRLGADPETGTGYHAVHILTPETDRTTHYFFTAVRYNVKTTDEELNLDIQDKIGKMRRFAFEEQDAPVIEAQQRNIDGSQTSIDPLILAIDVGPVRYKQVLQKLIAAEQG